MFPLGSLGEGVEVVDVCLVVFAIVVFKGLKGDDFAELFLVVR